MDNRIDAIYGRQSIDKKDSISIESQFEFCRYELKGGEAKEYKDNYDKYISHVANKEQIQGGVFYAVTEAKLIEGSAVLLGSNPITPTLEIEEIKNLKVDEPHESTQTIREPLFLNTLYDAMIKALK